MVTTAANKQCRGLVNAYGRTPVASRGNICVFELDGRYYVVEVGDYQVLSIGTDNPAGGGRWFANGLGDDAIRYVAHGRSRAAAMAMLRRATE